MKFNFINNLIKKVKLFIFINKLNKSDLNYIIDLLEFEIKYLKKDDDRESKQVTKDIELILDKLYYIYDIIENRK